MNFQQWWRAHEHALAAQYYDGRNWSGIYHLLRLAFEAGQRAGQQHS